jgi:hypothetical protein
MPALAAQDVQREHPNPRGVVAACLFGRGSARISLLQLLIVEEFLKPCLGFQFDGFRFFICRGNDTVGFILLFLFKVTGHDTRDNDYRDYQDNNVAYYYEY